MKRSRMWGECLSECLGTFILVFFGVGSVHTAVACGAQQGLWQVAVVWGVAIGLAIYATGAVSGTHINPAVTITMAAFRGFSWRKVPAFLLAQLVGAVIGAAVLYGLFSGLIARFEAQNDITRGGPGSELSAMMYGEYFPNPAMIGTTPEAYASVSRAQAFMGEAVGTAFLLMFILAMTDRKNPGRPMGTMHATFIGLTVAIIISIVAPITQAGLNPARDFGPRLFAYFAGWASVAIPGPRGGFLDVYILAPIIGGLAGALVYDLLVGRYMSAEGHRETGTTATAASAHE
jgi:glycerol uptake facilitator protein